MERGGRQPVSGAGSLPRAPHAQAGVGGARLPAAFPPPCPRGSCPLPSSPEREPLLAPAGGGKASSAREPSSPADTPPAPVADREAGGSSGALFGASLCWPKRGPGSQEGPPRGRKAEVAFGCLRGGPPSADPRLRPALALPGNALRAAGKRGVSPPKLGGERPGLVPKHSLGCEAVGEVAVKAPWQVARDCWARL